MKSDHIRLEITSLLPIFRCNRCGAVLPLDLPMSIPRLLRIKESFLEEHPSTGPCKPRSHSGRLVEPKY